MAEENFVEHKLYNGKVTLRFYHGSHRYKVGNQWIKSPSNIISIKDKSGGLVIWATELYREFLLGKFPQISEDDIYEGCDLHTVKKQEAANIGTEVHKWIEAYIKGEKPTMPESREGQIGVNAFLDWEKENSVKFLSSERVVFSRKYGFAGTMDIEAKVNGKLCLIDIKTSSDIRNEYFMQTAAYLKADQEESGRKYKGRWIIRLAKESEKEYTARMAKKNDIRAKKGKGSVNYPQYQVFEAKFLDETAGNLERDFEAFLACKKVREFEDATGFWATQRNG